MFQTTSHAAQKIKDLLKSQNNTAQVGKTQDVQVKVRDKFKIAPKQKPKNIHVGKVRNLSDRHVLLTLLNPKFKYNLTFKF